jgi:hypothetical protein
MRPIRGEPIDVWVRHGRPARFVWRGRLYTVMFVLDRRSSPARPGPSPSTQPGTEGEPPGSQEFWLVEATPLRGVAAATYELMHDTATDRWSLSRS